MARRSASARVRVTQGGVVVPGCYQRLLDGEMARHCRTGGKYGRIGFAVDGVRFYRRPRGVLEALEAGQPVEVVRGRVENPWPDPPLALPWPPEVRRVRVLADDTVTPPSLNQDQTLVRQVESEAD